MNRKLIEQKIAEYEKLLDTDKAAQYIKANTAIEILEVVLRLDMSDRLDRIEIKIEGLENRLKDIVSMYKELKSAKETKTKTKAKRK